MTKVEVSEAAAEDLDELIRTHSLSADTKVRVRRSLGPLPRFPRMGAELEGRWKGFRFLVGPWQWMLFVYVCFEDEDRVIVVSVQDGRSARTPTSDR